MPNSTERRQAGQPRSVVCLVGYVLRQREWAERGEECLKEDACPGKECPHPMTCTTRNRELQAGEKK